jgi:O-antigen ligase
VRPSDWIVTLVAALLPWAFGGVDPWAYRTAGLALALAFALRSREPAGARRPPSWYRPALALSVWAAIQIVPLPPALLGAVAPLSFEAARNGLPAWPEGGSAGEAIAAAAIAQLPPEARSGAEGGAWIPSVNPPSSWRPISMAPGSGLDSLLWFVALGLAAAVVAGGAVSRSVRRRERALVLASLVMVACVGVGFWAAGERGRVLGWRDASFGMPFGPYVNGAHFGGAMEIAAPWLVGIAIGSAVQGRRGRLNATLAAAGAAACAIGALLCGSKMAALLVLVACLIPIVAVVARSRRRVPMALGVLLAGAAAAAVALFGPLGDRTREFLLTIGRDPSSWDRMLAWKASIRLWAEQPWTGIGYGAFRFAFPGVLPAGESEAWAQLHNDWLEAFVCSGLVGATLLAWLVAAWLRGVRSAWRADSAGPARWARAGLLCGVAALSIHAFVDFNHQIPANALLFVFAATHAACAPESREGADA